jgi:hypothetical protein
MPESCATQLLNKTVVGSDTAHLTLQQDDNLSKKIAFPRLIHSGCPFNLAAISSVDWRGHPETWNESSLG